MSRYRLRPSAAQEATLLGHCAHARYVWNLCVEQESQWRPGRGKMPGFAGRCRQLSEARAAEPWLAAGSVIVQQQAIRDHDQAMRNYYAGTHRRPSWRKASRDEGFRIVHLKPRDVRRLNRNTGEVRIPKAGWVRFRWSRQVPQDAKSFRVTRDRAGRWHVAFAVVPEPVPAPGTGEAVGIDRGVVITAALSTGEKLHCPGMSSRERARLRRAERRKARHGRARQSRSGACWCGAHRTRRLAGWRQSGRPGPACAAVPAGGWTRTRATAKPGSAVSPAASPATRTSTPASTSRRDTPEGHRRVSVNLNCLPP